MSSIPEDIKRLIISITQKHGVLKVALFGSIVKGSFSPSSDIDILIEFEGRKSLFDLIRLEDELEIALGRKVDVTTYNSLHPLLKESILQEQVVLS
jgi:hypothetical protein